MIQKLFLSFVLSTSFITSLCHAATGDDGTSYFELGSSVRYVSGRFNLEMEERTFLTTPTKPTKPKSQAVLMYDGRPTPIEETVFREEALLVSGRDGRRQVTDTGDFPWCLHGHMSMEFGGREYGGSGTLIGPHHFLTAAHCVYKPETGEAATNIRIRLGLNDRAAMFGEVLGTKVYLYNQWMTSRNDDFDMALVILNQSIGHETGWAGLLCLEDKELSDHAVHVTGYPGDKGFRTLWTMDNRIGRITREKVYYPIDTYGGQSGGAIWIKKWGMPYVVGNHAYGGTLSDGGNFGVRLSERKIRDLVTWIGETLIIDEPRAPEPVIRPRAKATSGGGGGSAVARGRVHRSGGTSGPPPAISPTTMGRSGAGGSSLRASAPVAAALPTAPTAARSTAVSPPSVPLTAGAGDGAAAGSSVPRPLGSPIPSVARGFEEEYRRFLNMRLVYKPNKDNDTGRVDIAVSRFIDLGVDPLSGTFDLRAFGDAGRYISIHTGYRKGKIAANKDKLEIFLCPKFLAERELGSTATHLAPIMGEWSNPVGYFWTWGNWDNLDWYDYLVTGDVGRAADKYLHEIRAGLYLHSDLTQAQRMHDVAVALSSRRTAEGRRASTYTRWHNPPLSVLHATIKVICKQIFIYMS